MYKKFDFTQKANSDFLYKCYLFVISTRFSGSVIFWLFTRKQWILQYLETQCTRNIYVHFHIYLVNFERVLSTKVMFVIENSIPSHPASTTRNIENKKHQNLQRGGSGVRTHRSGTFRPRGTFPKGRIVRGNIVMVLFEC